MNKKNSIPVLSNLEKAELQLFKKYMRLSSERDLYTRPQAAHRLNCSINTLDDDFVIPYRMKIVLRNNTPFIPKVEIDRVIAEELDKRLVHRGAIARQGNDV